MFKKLIRTLTRVKQSPEMLDDLEKDENIQATPMQTDERPIVRFGMWALAIGFGGFLLWSGLAPLDEGVPGVGVVSADTKRKTIQHLRGGVVDALLVREGSRVKMGDELVRLNDTDIKAQLDITRGQYFQAKAMEARLLAERDSRDRVVFDPLLVEAAGTEKRAEEAVRTQTQLFAARRSALKSELGTMDETIVGLNNQITGLRSVENGKKTQIQLIEREVQSFRGLVEEGFVPRNKLYELERVLADLSGTRGSDLAQIMRSEAGINEMKLRKLQRQQDYRKEVETLLSDVQKEVNAQADRLKALQEEFDRTVIKAPTDGYVVAMEAHTIGGVIRAGDRIMDIVPEGDVLIVEAQLPVNLIDKVQVGQLANIHFQLVLAGGVQPTIIGKVVQVSADRLTEQRTGMPYFSARIEITPEGQAEIAKNKIKVQSGMQTDVVVVTGERTVLQYLLGPLWSRLRSGMKEH